MITDHISNVIQNVRSILLGSLLIGGALTPGVRAQAQYLLAQQPVAGPPGVSVQITKFQDQRQQSTAGSSEKRNWKVRMEWLAKLMKTGPGAVAVLIERLKDEKAPPYTRALAAQAFFTAPFLLATEPPPAASASRDKSPGTLAQNSDDAGRVLKGTGILESMAWSPDSMTLAIHSATFRRVSRPTGDLARSMPPSPGRSM